MPPDLLERPETRDATPETGPSDQDAGWFEDFLPQEAPTAPEIPDDVERDIRAFADALYPQYVPVSERRPEEERRVLRALQEQTASVAAFAETLVSEYDAGIESGLLPPTGLIIDHNGVVSRRMLEALETVHARASVVRRLLTVAPASTQVGGLDLTLEDLRDELRAVYREYGNLRLDPQSKTLTVITENIVLTDTRGGTTYVADLGRLRVSLGCASLSPSSGSSSNFRYAGTVPGQGAPGRPQFLHPNILSGVMCAGEAQAGLTSALRGGRLGDALLIVHVYLNTYGGANPHLRIEDWGSVLCSDCDAPSGADPATCGGCRQLFCASCIQTCSACEGVYCRACALVSGEGSARTYGCPSCAGEVACTRCARGVPQAGSEIDAETGLCAACLYVWLEEQDRQSVGDAEFTDLLRLERETREAAGSDTDDAAELPEDGPVGNVTVTDPAPSVFRPTTPIPERLLTPPRVRGNADPWYEHLRGISPSPPGAVPAPEPVRSARRYRDAEGRWVVNENRG